MMAGDKCKHTLACMETAEGSPCMLHSLLITVENGSRQKWTISLCVDPSLKGYITDK